MCAQIATCNYLTIRHQFIRNVNSKVRVNSSYSSLGRCCPVFSICYGWRHVDQLLSASRFYAVACEVFEKRHCWCKHSPKIAQRIFTKFYDF